MAHSVSRRRFLQASAAASVAGSLMVHAAEKAPGDVEEENATSRLRIGLIGVGNRGTYLLRLALTEPVEVRAICDISAPHLDRALKLVESTGGKRPEGYNRGPTDYQRMLQRDDLDAVIIATPMQLHGTMSTDALRANKHVLSEVAAAMELDECWQMVHAARESKKTYMLAENCCYWPHILTLLNMVGQGVFGELTFAECGYVHDCRGLMFDGKGSLTWRGEMIRDYAGNLYPTHSLGPVAHWLGINRGDRMVSLVARQTRHASLDHYLAGHFKPDDPLRKTKFKTGDSTSVLIQTAKGRVIDLRYDITSARPVPTTTYYSLQGTTAAYDSRIDGIWIDGRSKSHKWEPLATYADEFQHPLWKELGKKAEGSGHSGGDFFVIHEFLEAIRSGKPPRVDVFDAAAWSSIIPLSAKSIAGGGVPLEIPDFTNGLWEDRLPYASLSS